jgi:hypothetical protein
MKPLWTGNDSRDSSGLCSGAQRCAAMVFMLFSCIDDVHVEAVFSETKEHGAGFASKQHLFFSA